MDYENIVYGNNNLQGQTGCYIEQKEVFWDRREITEIELPIGGGFTLDDGTFISISDFMLGSPTKSIKMVLKDRFGDIVAVQEVVSSSPDLIYRGSYLSCYFIVDSKLSDSLIPGSYSLFVYVVNKIPENNKSPERVIFNKMVTTPSGIEVTVF